MVRISSLFYHVFFILLTWDLSGSTGLTSRHDQPLLGRNLPEVVNNVVWVKQIIHKTEHTLDTARVLLGDLPRISNLTSKAESLLEDLKAYMKEQYQFWVSETEEALRDEESPLQLQVNGNLMDFDRVDGTLRVNIY
jgi:dynein heavy chain 2